MTAIDKPNTLVHIPEYERSRLFYPFRYKQDSLDFYYNGYEVLQHSFQGYKDSTFDFQHTLDDYPYMK